MNKLTEPKRRNLAKLSKSPVTKIAQNGLNASHGRIAFLANFSDFEDFAVRGESVDAGTYKILEFSLRQIRAYLARLLWENEVYLGIDVIDNLLFNILRENSGVSPIKSFFDTISRLGMHRPGFVVFPLHSFGVLGLGFFQFFNEATTCFAPPGLGLIVSAQTNKRSETISFLNKAKEHFGITRELPLNLIEHFAASRSLQWLDHNPLMAVKVRSLSGSYYENQFIYKLKLRLSTCLVMMLSALGEQMSKDEVLSAGSSSRINNWQTMDLHHYLVFETQLNQRKHLDLMCVPINGARLELAQLSDLNVDLDPRVWMRRPRQIRVLAIRDALRKMELRYLQHNVIGNIDNTASRICRKLLNSLEAFRRSFSAASSHSEQTVSLAIAVESLLTDNYAAGVTERIVRRARLCLRGTPRCRTYVQAVRELYEARSAIVHQGLGSSKMDLTEARRAFVHCFMHISRILDRLPSSSGSPIGDYLKD